MVKNTIAKEHNITVHLSDNHDNYIAAYKYVCKTDNQVFHSISHLDLSEIGSPKTNNSTKAYRDSRKRARELNDKSPPENCKKKCFKPRRLSNVSEFLIKHDIKRDRELFAAAKKRKDEGQMDLTNFILTKSSKVLNDTIQKTWKMQTASECLQREKKSRMDILR